MPDSSCDATKSKSHDKSRLELIIKHVFSTAHSLNRTKLGRKVPRHPKTSKVWDVKATYLFLLIEKAKNRPRSRTSSTLNERTWLLRDLNQPIEQNGRRLQCEAESQRDFALLNVWHLLIFASRRHRLDGVSSD